MTSFFDDHKSAAGPAAPKHAEIHVYGAYAFVLDPSAIEAVLPALKRDGWKTTPGGPRGYQIEPHTTYHCRINDDGHLWAASSLVHRMALRLEQEGYDVVIHRHTRWPYQRCADSRVLGHRGQRADYRALLTTMNVEPYGQINCRGREVAEYIALVADYFCRARIVVVARNRREAKRLHRRLTDKTNRPIALYPQTPWGQGQDHWMIVGTMRLWANCCADDWEIVLFAEPSCIFAKQSIEQATWQRRVARYCFRQPDQEIGPRGELRLEELCGPKIYRSAATQPGTADVAVRFVRTTPTPYGRQCRGLERKRQLWSDKARNDTIASAIINEAYLFPNRSGGQPLSVSVLVESEEHAYHLLPYLPGWELRTGESVDPLGITGVEHRQIVTMTYAHHHRITTDVLVRADGSPGWPDVIYPRHVFQHTDQVTLVDFDDHGDDIANKYTASRRDAYRERGWTIEG